MKHLLHYNCVALTPIWIRKPHLAWWRLQIGIMQLVAFRCKGNVPEWPHQNMCGSFYQKMQRRERTASSQPLCYYYPLEIDDVPVLHGCFANVGREIIWGDCCGSLVMSMPLSAGWIEKKRAAGKRKGIWLSSFPQQVFDQTLKGDYWRYCSISLCRAFPRQILFKA